MNLRIVLLCSTVILGAWAPNPSIYQHPIDLDLETSGAVYHYLATHSLQTLSYSVGPLQPVLDMGVRNLAWLDHINQNQPVKLSFSSQSTEKGIPIDAPLVYSGKIVLQEFTALQKQLPRPMYNVLFQNAPFTDKPPIAQADYLKWGLKVDSVYQIASRWLMMQPYLDRLAQARQADVRGFYFLQKEPNLANELSHFANLTQNKQNQLQTWLLELCYNNLADDSDCATEFAKALSQNDLTQFYSQYFTNAQYLWDGFFKIAVARTDIQWTQSSVLNFPFVDPNNEAVKDFLKTNIEDEWRWQNWNLKLNFLSTGEALAHVEFVPGSTPHVNAVGGSTITMDANAPLSEYDVQWTIRHEFGHVLGFVDCYVEFYEPKGQDVVTYQLDTNNLMCSRRGHLMAIHYNELKRVYYKP